jgi:hypothetical protein
VNGSATIDYDKAAWDVLAANYGLPQPTLTLAAFFNQAQANALTYQQILSELQTNPPPIYTNQIYAMNGATVTNLPARTTQPTTFAYTPGQLTNHTGRIGLGGIARFKVSDPPGGGNSGNLLYGDFTLQYTNARIALGGSGWYLRGNIPPATAAFDLLNVVTVETNNSLAISGDLGVSYEVANLLYSTPADALRVVGNFTFTGAIFNPVPAISRVALSGGNIIYNATNGNAGGSYTVLSCTNVALPLAAWTTNTSGVFDSNGACSNSISLNSGEPARFYRLRQP